MFSDAEGYSAFTSFPRLLRVARIVWENEHNWLWRRHERKFEALRQVVLTRSLCRLVDAGRGGLNFRPVRP